MSYKLRSRSPKLPGTIIIDSDFLILYAFKKLPQAVQTSIIDITQLANAYVETIKNRFGDEDLIISTPDINIIASTIGRELFDFNVNINNRYSLCKPQKTRSNLQTIRLEFESVLVRVNNFITYLITNKERILSVLRKVETFEVANDEFDRSIDHLTNLCQNPEYFQIKGGHVAAFLPLNQPLYSTVCFSIVPSLITTSVWMRPPQRLHLFFDILITTLSIREFFPNVYISYESRHNFVQSRKGDTNIVIFTGQPQNGYNIRKQFPRHILFILNGAGHNPVVVTELANLEQALQSVIRLALQNQGQDCAGPNSILIHADVFNDFLNILIEKLESLQKNVGSFLDDNTLVGPNTDPNHTAKISKLFCKYRRYFVYGGCLNPFSGLIYPTVLHKPLKDGPCYEEFFAPVIMLQSYQDDSELANYFETREYSRNAMYVTVFGKSTYISDLVSKGLHTSQNILVNTDLHIEERGFLPYGGNGPDASCIIVDGYKQPGATLPQRDISNYLLKFMTTQEKFYVN